MHIDLGFPTRSQSRGQVSAILRLVNLEDDFVHGPLT